MKKLMFSLFAAMMLIGVQAIAQDATNEKPIWRPSVDITMSYSSRYISDGWVINPERTGTTTTVTPASTTNPKNGTTGLATTTR